MLEEYYVQCIYLITLTQWSNQVYLWHLQYICLVLLNKHNFIWYYNLSLHTNSVKTTTYILHTTLKYVNSYHCEVVKECLVPTWASGENLLFEIKFSTAFCFGICWRFFTNRCLNIANLRNGFTPNPKVKPKLLIKRYMICWIDKVLTYLCKYNNLFKKRVRVGVF